MIRRITSSLTFLLMLNVMALGDGLYSIEMPTMPAMNGMDHSPSRGSDTGQVPPKKGCNLPWSTGCASASPCAPAAMIARLSTAVLSSATDGVPIGAAVRVPTWADVAPDHPPPRI